MKKRILSMLLVIVMVLSVLPVQALAEGTEDPVSTMVIKRVDGTDFKVGNKVPMGAYASNESTTKLDGVTWFGDNDNVAVIDPTTGVLTCKTAGIVNITAKKENYADVTREITVAANALKICKKDDASVVTQIFEGDEIELKVLDSADKELTVKEWKSSNDAAATVVGGKLTGVSRKAAASVTITATVEGFAEPAELTIPVYSKTIEVDDGKVYVNETLTLDPKINGTSATGVAVTMDNSASKGSVDISGYTIKGKKAGEVTLKFSKTEGGIDYTGSCKVTVEKYPLTIKADGGKDSFYVGKTYQLAAYRPDGTKVEIDKWESSNSSFAEIDNTGRMTVLVAGVGKSVTITATPQYTATNTVAILEKIILANSLKIKDDSGKEVTEVNVDASVQLVALDGNGDPVDGVTWASSDNQKATVSPSGILTGLRQTSDSVKITAKKSGYIDGEMQVNVSLKDFAVQNEAGESVTDVVLQKDNKLQLKAVKDGAPISAIWSSTSDKVTVDTRGLVTAVASTRGEKVRIDAQVPGYATQSVNVTVKSAPAFSRIELAGDDSRPDKLAVGEEPRALVAFDADGFEVKDVQWSVPADSCASLAEGKLTGVSAGEVTVTAKKENYGEKTLTVSVEVVPAAELVIPALPAAKDGIISVQVDANLPLTIAEVKPSYATYKSYAWSSSDESVVKIEDGKMIALKPGEVTLTATPVTSAGAAMRTNDGCVELRVRVLPKEYIELAGSTRSEMEMTAGEGLDLQAVVKGENGETITGKDVKWRYVGSVPKNLTDLTGNTLTAMPHPTVAFDVELEAYVDDPELSSLSASVTVHVIPRTTNIALKKGAEDVTDKTAVLDVKNTDGITIQAEIKPDDARQIVSWQVKDPNGICQYTPSDNAVVIKPISSLKTGTVTVIATAADGTSKTAQTTVQIAKMAETLEILDLKDAPEVNYLRGGETLRLRTSFDNDKTLTDRGIKWEITGEGKAYASISEDGVLDIAAVSERTTITVTATAKANAAATDSKEITLCPSVKSIKIVGEDGATLKNVISYTSDAIQLYIKVNPEDGYIDSFVWDSSNKAVAEVDPESGELTLQGVAGKTQITCTADDGSKVRGIYNLEVVMAAGYVTIDGPKEVCPEDEDLGKLVSGKSAVLKATVYTDDTMDELAGNQRVIWSVEDVFGNATKAASINSRGRLVAKTVNYGTEVVVYAKSVENGEVIGEHHVTILPKKARTFMAAREGEDGTEILGSTLYMNAGESTVIFGQWFTREDGLYDEYDCTYFSSNSGVAKIYEDGALETLKKGSATITVRATDPDTRNVYTAKFTLKVINTVDHIVISKPDKAADYVRSGERMNLSATVWSNEVETIKADNEGVTWSVFEKSGTDLVATGAAYMTSGGTIVANSVTRNTPVVVVATSKENPSIIAEFPLTIRPAKAYTVTARCENEAGDWVVPTGAVSLEKGTLFTSRIWVEVYVSDPNSLDDGKTLSNPTITWESDNKKVVNVVDGQLAYTGKIGKAKVTPVFKAGNATYRGNAVTLNIVKYVNSVKVTKKYANQELYSGKSLVMYAEVDKEASIRRVSWSLVGVGDSEVASINASTGLIRARKGLTEQVDITVQATAVDGSGVSDTMEVTIYPLTTRVKITTEDDITALEKGETAELTAVLLVGEEEDQANQNAVKWSSSRSSVVYVDKDGNITAKRKGTATIKAKATDGSGKYATIKVTVVNP